MARCMAGRFSLSLLLVWVLVAASAEECSEDPASALTTQLMVLVGDRAAQTCAVCSGEVMAKIEELEEEMFTMSEDHQKGLGDVEDMVHRLQHDSERDRDVLHSYIDVAQEDRKTIRATLVALQQQLTVDVEDLKTEVAGVNQEAHSNLTEEVFHLQGEIESLKSALENLQSYIKGGARTTRDAPSTCGEKVMLAPTGYLAPVETGTYKNNTDCSWVIERPVGVRIKITWLMFALQRSADCRCDYVELWDGNDTKELLGGKRYCGYIDPPTMTSVSNRLEVKFHSDSSGVYAGFKIKYESVEE